ncbi:uncharacterized protein LOC119963667 [Scyliorhinus canicula]|uniref:uncharacterized protein LOC119963667 n=1 Tax=Scyliorhinus canicula TaxID=7830 RepID=UPI0018F72D29|nr:uncharacterized protein LOC119963667 [Scyliorhinus canicula]
MNLNGDYLQLILTLQCTHMLLQVTEGEPGRIEVSQTPSEIKASEGQSINLECSWDEDLQVESVRIDWTKDSEMILSATSLGPTANPVYNRRSSTINKTKAKLTINSITQDDAGLYICQIFIEIPPPVQRGSGNGTQLTVQAGGNKVHYWPVLGVFVLLVLSVPVILYYKKSQRNLVMPVPIDVMREEIHEENNENEGNEENSSSRGSSQWMTSSLYESIDYFAIKDENEEASCASPTAEFSTSCTMQKEKSLFKIDFA